MTNVELWVGDITTRYAREEDSVEGDGRDRILVVQRSGGQGVEFSETVISERGIGLEQLRLLLMQHSSSLRDG